MDELELDFRYLDEHIDMIKSKIITYGTLSVFNGIKNRIYIITKNGDDFTYEYTINHIEKIPITYNDIIADIMFMYKNSIGKITLIYRLYMDGYNPRTRSQFRELWGDILYVDIETYKLTSKNINADFLSNVVFNLDLSEDELKFFGRPEDYIFKDTHDNIIMGYDLI